MNASFPTATYEFVSFVFRITLVSGLTWDS